MPFRGLASCSSYSLWLLECQEACQGHRHLDETRNTTFCDVKGLCSFKRTLEVVTDGISSIIVKCLRGGLWFDTLCPEFFSHSIHQRTWGSQALPAMCACPSCAATTSERRNSTSAGERFRIGSQVTGGDGAEPASSSLRGYAGL